MGSSHLKNLDYSVVQQCMHCGLCLPTCPTYEATKLERHSPRGRIALMRAIADGELQASKTFGEEAGKLIDGGYQVDGVLRQLTTATSALAEQAAQIRIGMEQQNARGPAPGRRVLERDQVMPGSPFPDPVADQQHAV